MPWNDTKLIWSWQTGRFGLSDPPVFHIQFFREDWGMWIRWQLNFGLHPYKRPGNWVARLKMEYQYKKRWAKHL